MKKYDLHTHTIASDGTYTVRELLERAKGNGLKGVAITDHDTIDGLEEAEKVAKEIGIELIPGIEFSCNLGDNEIHILGYFVDYKNAKIIEELYNLDKIRKERNLKIIEKLKKYKLYITEEEIQEEATGNIVSKAHIANLLVKKGYVYTRRDAFKQYLGSTGVAYVKKENFKPEDAVKIIKENGGIAVVAHPKLISTNDNTVESIVENLKKIGLDGIEAEYSSFTLEDVIKYRKMAQKYDLIITGGSDFHGKNREGVDLGDQGITEEEYEILKNKKRSGGQL